MRCTDPDATSTRLGAASALRCRRRSSAARCVRAVADAPRSPLCPVAAARRGRRAGDQRRAADLRQRSAARMAGFASA